MLKQTITIDIPFSYVEDLRRVAKEQGIHTMAPTDDAARALLLWAVHMHRTYWKAQDEVAEMTRKEGKEG